MIEKPIIQTFLNLLIVLFAALGTLVLFSSPVKASHQNNGFQSDITLEAWTYIGFDQIQLRVHGPSSGNPNDDFLDVWPAVGYGDSEPSSYSVLGDYGQTIHATGCWFTDPAMTATCSFSWSSPNWSGPFWFRSLARDPLHRAVEEANYSPGGCSPANVTLYWYNTIDTYAHTCGVKWGSAPPPPPPSPPPGGGGSSNPNCPVNDTNFTNGYMTACAYAGTGEVNYLGTWAEPQVPNGSVTAQALKAPAPTSGWNDYYGGPFGRNDDFTVVWRGNIHFQGSSTGGPANYYFQIGNDDTYKLYIDDMNTPFASGGCCNTGPSYPKSIAYGWHTVKFVGYENTGAAGFTLFWDQDRTGPTTGSIGVVPLSNPTGRPLGASGTVFRFTISASDNYGLNTTYGSSRFYLGTYPYSRWDRVDYGAMGWDGSRFYYDVQLNDPYGKQYRAYINVYDLNGNGTTTDSNPAPFSIANSPPPVATYSSPCNGCKVSNSGSVTFTVNPVIDVDGQQVYYFFRVSASPSPDTNTVCIGPQQTSTSYTCNYAFTPGVTYYWHAHTYDGVAITWANSVWSFRLNNAPTVLSISGGPGGSWAGRQSYTITGQYRDSDGNGELTSPQALINYGVDGNNSAAYLLYQKNTCYILGGNGDSSGGPGYPGNQAWNPAPYTSLPWVSLTGCSWSTPNGTDLTVNWTIDIKDWNETNVNYYGYVNDPWMGSGWAGPFRTISIDTTAPTQNSLTVSTTNGWWQPNGSNTYNITLAASDNLSGVLQEYALVNYQGSNSGNYRGYFNWSSTNPIFALDQQSCAGGGFASKGGGWGEQYITLVGCSSSFSNNQRYVTFVVRPGANFGDFVQINDVSMYVLDNASNGNGWNNWDTNFGSDLTPPNNSLTSPPCNGSVKGTVTISNNASDGLSGMSRVEFYVDINTLLATDTNGSDGWSTSWNTTSLGAGTHTYSAKAFDVAGNYNTQSCDVTIDNGLPSLSVTNVTSTGAPYLSFIASAVKTNANSLRFDGTALDSDSGLDQILRSGYGYSFSSNSPSSQKNNSALAAIPSTNPNGTKSSFSWSKSIPDSQDSYSLKGFSQILFYAKDKAGNYSADSSSAPTLINVYYDVTPPQVPALNLSSGCGTSNLTMNYVSDYGTTGTVAANQQYWSVFAPYDYVAGVDKYQINRQVRNSSGTLKSNTTYQISHVLWVDGGSQPSPYSESITSGLASGDTVQYSVSSIDKFGNTSSPATASISVPGGVSPDTPINLSPNNNQWVNTNPFSNPGFSWTSKNNNPPSCTSGLTYKVRYQAPGASSFTEAGSPPTSNPVTNVTLPADGAYTWQAQDVENYSSLASPWSATASFGLDTNAPTVAYAGSVNRDQATNLNTFRVTANDALPGSGLDGSMVSPANSPNGTGGSFGAFYQNPVTLAWVPVTSYRYQNGGSGPFALVTGSATTPIGYNGQTNVVFEFDIPIQVNNIYVTSYCARVADIAGNKSSSWNCGPGGGGGGQTINTSWLQVTGGDVHTNYNVDALAAPPAGSPPANFDKKLSVAGVNRSFVGVSNSPTLDNYSSSGSPSNSNGRNPIPYPSYNDLYNRLYVQAAPGVEKREVTSTATINQGFFDGLTSPNTVYHLADDATVSSTINFSTGNKSVVVFVDKLLTFNNTASVMTVGGNNTVIWITKNGIIINSGVTDLDGAFISEGVINTSNGTTGLTTTPALNIRGLIASIPLNGGGGTDYLLFRRNLGPVQNSSSPAEKITFDPKYYIWAQNTFGQSTYNWTEAKP